MNKKAFTLVELIVVITILAVLATVWFISLQWYVVNGRDTVRVSDIKSIEKSLWLYALKESQYLQPVDWVSFTSSWVLLSTQWILDEKSLWKIWVFWNIKDPLSDEYYQYAINSQKNKYQILGLLEQQELSLLTSSYALWDVYPKLFWDEVWFIYESDNPFVNPENPIDIFNESNSLDIFINNEDINYGVTWSGIIKTLAPILSHMRSCKTLYELWSVKVSGLYKIVSEDWNVQEEFCEMEIKSWGWSLLAAAPADSVDFWNRYDEGIWKDPHYNFDIIDWYQDEEYLSKSYETLDTNEIMLCQENNTMCFIFPHKKNIPLYNFFRDNLSYIMMSYNLEKYSDIWNRNVLTSFLNTYNTTYFEKPAECWAIGINISWAEWFTTQIMWYGWDFDQPCIDPYWWWEVDGPIDNYGLWLWIYFWNTWYRRDSDYVEIPDLAWYQKYNIWWKYRDIWDDIKNWPAVFMSDTWYVFGR